MILKYIKQYHNVILIIISVFICTVKSYAEKQEKLFIITPPKLVKVEDMSYSIPFAVDQNAHTHVAIKIPKNFELYSSDENSAQYIPINDEHKFDPKEVIGVAVFAISDSDLDHHMNEFKNVIANSYENVKIIKNNIETKNHYKIATLIVSLELNGKQRLVVFRNYFTKYDCVQVHYSITIDDMNVAKTLEKAKKFLDDPNYIKVKLALNLKGEPNLLE